VGAFINGWMHSTQNFVVTYPWIQENILPSLAKGLSLKWLNPFAFCLYVNSWGNPKWKHRMERRYAAPFLVEWLKAFRLYPLWKTAEITRSCID
jgi:hypothetical protein